MISKNIVRIRKKLDKLDNKFLDIIKKRTKLVDLVLKNKKYKKDIIDRKRISIILKNISIKSTHGLSFKKNSAYLKKSDHKNIYNNIYGNLAIHYINFFINIFYKVDFKNINLYSFNKFSIDSDSW